MTQEQQFDEAGVFIPLSHLLEIRKELQEVRDRTEQQATKKLFLLHLVKMKMKDMDELIARTH